MSNNIVSYHEEMNNHILLYCPIGEKFILLELILLLHKYSMKSYCPVLAFRPGES
jgi:hypothetical protein